MMIGSLRAGGPRRPSRQAGLPPVEDDSNAPAFEIDLLDDEPSGAGPDDEFAEENDEN